MRLLGIANQIVSAGMRKHINIECFGGIRKLVVGLRKFQARPTTPSPWIQPFDPPHFAVTRSK
jgi:hypothetical protein